MSTTKKPSRRRLAQVYTEAAKLVELGKRYYACDAIGQVIGSYDEEKPETKLFYEFFYPGNLAYSSFGWWDSDNFFEFMGAKTTTAFIPSQTPRIIALLLMAELAKDGQLD